MSQPLNFPARIYQILENESPEIIQWNSNGLSFRIVNHIRFEAEVIPKYFRHRKLSSVQRQLNVYGFRSISRGEHKRSFYHPLFRRGNWEVVKQMARYVPTKGGQQSMEIDPNFLESALPTEEAHNTCPTPAGRQVTPIITNRGTPSSNALRVCLDDDFAPDYFASDFHFTSDVGHEHNNITVQPVDYSIPIDFQLSHHTSVDNFASVSCDSNQMKCEGSAQEDVCDWALSDDTSTLWADLGFEMEGNILYGEDNSADWVKGSHGISVPGRARRTSSARLFSTLTPPPEGEQAGGCQQLSKSQVPEWWEGATYSVATEPLEVVTSNACGGDQYMSCKVECAEGEPQTVEWATAAARYRTDSMNDLYALCAELM